MTTQAVVFCFSLLFPMFAVGLAAGEEADPAELLRQGIQHIANFNTEVHTEAQLQDLAGYIPAGKQAEVTLSYRVIKPSGAEDLEVRILENIYPHPLGTYLRSPSSQFEHITKSVIGTGEFVRQGAPAYPIAKEPLPSKAVMSSDASTDMETVSRWTRWNDWQKQRQEWRAQRATSLPGEEFQVLGSQETFRRKAGLEWSEEAGKLLHKMALSIKANSDPQLQGVYGTLLQLQSRATGTGTGSKVDPGGILLSRYATDALGANLRIRAVRYSKETGTVTVEGDRSAVGIDSDLLATAVRLAYTFDDIPFFSLEWAQTMDEQWGREEHRLSKRLLHRLVTDLDFYRRFKRVAFDVRDINGRVHKVAFLQELDRRFAHEVEERTPQRVSLVFQPDWLRHTRFGEILFWADQSLKELWFGAGVWDVRPSRALNVAQNIAPRFWDDRDSNNKREELFRGFADRWWFTPGGRAVLGPGLLDLTQVQPVLNTNHTTNSSEHQDSLEETFAGYRTRGGQTATVPLSLIMPDPSVQSFLKRYQHDAYAQQVVDDVTNRFDLYAREMPEWEALRQIFRAYALARWLKKHAPGVGQELLANLPPPRPPSMPLPSTWPDPRLFVLAVTEEPADATLYSGGIVGGIGFELDRVKAVSEVSAPNDPGNTIDPNTVSVEVDIPGITKRVKRHEELHGHPSSEKSGDNTATLFEAGTETNCDTFEGYVAYRDHLLRHHGLWLSWLRAHLTGYQSVMLLGSTLIVALGSWFLGWRKGKIKNPRLEGLAVLLDGIVWFLVLILLMSSDDEKTTTGAVLFGLVFITALVLYAGDRVGRLGLTFVATLIATCSVIWQLGIGEFTEVFTSARVGIPEVPFAEAAPIPAWALCQLIAASEGLKLTNAVDPAHALYPPVILLAAVTIWLDSIARNDIA